jgi:ribosomal protein L11 methylase PrmA
MSGYVLNPDKWYNNVTERVQTPDGTLFVIIIENEEGIPIMIQVSGAKTGTPVAAWCDALVRVCNIALAQGVDFMQLIEEFSNITTSKAIRLVSGVTSRSGPEGVAIALMRYRDGKSIEREEEEELDDSDDESDDVRPRWRIPPHHR